MPWLATYCRVIVLYKVYSWTLKEYISSCNFNELFTKQLVNICKYHECVLIIYYVCLR